MRTIFHLTTKAAWDRAEALGRYEADSMASEGFIHFSRPHQLLGVAGRYFRGVPELVLLQVCQERVTAPVKYEGAGEDQFPHVYGPLNLDAVVSVTTPLNGPGGFQLPAEFRLVGDTLVRRGRPGDEAEITSVHTHAWQQSYVGIVPEKFLRERPLSFRARLNWWRAVVEGKDPWAAYVAESSEHGIVGFCGFGPSRDLEMTEHGEIGAIYCLNEYKGKGIGAALLRESQRDQKMSGKKFSYLWVLQENPTVEFYRRMGGTELDRKKTVELGGQSLVEVAYQWKL